MGYYWIYYLLPIALAFSQQNPMFVLLVAVFLLVRKWLPDPVVILRNLGRISSLKRQARLNPANMIARRDLAVAYLELRMPRSALRFLDEAQTRDPNDAEVAYLRGQSLLRIGEDEKALREFGRAVGVDTEAGEPLSSSPQLERSFRRFHEAYLGAASALERLGRDEQAEEALELAASTNTSTLEPLVRLARVRQRRGDSKGASEAIRDARRTFSELPGFLKRRQIGWWARTLI